MRRWERKRLTVGGQIGVQGRNNFEAVGGGGRVFHLVSPNDLGEGGREDAGGGNGPLLSPSVAARAPTELAPQGSQFQEPP